MESFSFVSYWPFSNLFLPKLVVMVQAQQNGRQMVNGHHYDLGLDSPTVVCSYD